MSGVWMLKSQVKKLTTGKGPRPTRLQLTSEGENVGVASDGAIDEVPGVGKGKRV